MHYSPVKQEHVVARTTVVQAQIEVALKKYNYAAMRHFLLTLKTDGETTESKSQICQCNFDFTKAKSTKIIRACFPLFSELDIKFEHGC